ncbi:DMT family transporter [Spongiibacter sp. UBA1325]|uniref:DMT family transporter n=1 Tax=Spongiibacter sp. UBA1325 TaxID=1947543 RepID=UPI00257BA77E|nr:DMT family transporter [Spongiibacter sp. UBA1325]
MLVRFVYLLVILIWATTPLSIKLGGDSLAPIAALSLRILIAFFVGSALCTLFGVAGLNIRRHWKLYFAASISLFPNMALVYLAAQYIPSGLIALMFGLSPFFTAALAWPMLGERMLVPRKLFAIALAALGLLCILADDVVITGDSYTGIALMLLSNLLFSGSAVWVKKLNATIVVSPVEQALGAMAFALPGMLLSWWLWVGFEPLVFSAVSLGSLLYLALFASLVGFVAYYYILKVMPVETVSLIPLVSPVLALAIGSVVVDEPITPAMLLGAGMIITALAVHQGLWRQRSPMNTAMDTRS